MLSLFGEGFLIGLVVCMPMGAIGMLCLRYILIQGKPSGIAAGLGIATADAIAACIAALGVTAILTFVKSHDTWIQTLGSFILIGFGAYLLFTDKSNVKKKIERGLIHIYIIMLMVTLTNPITFLSFSGIFAALGLESLENDLTAVIFLSFGVFFGSLAWWLMLTVATMFFTINQKFVHLINEVAGTVLILMGLISLYSSWF